MNRRILFAIVLSVIAVPLFVWPIAVPAPKPPDTLTHHIAGSGEELSHLQINHTVSYENLSTDGKRVLRKTIATNNNTYTVRQGHGAPATFPYNDSPTFVVYRNTTYDVYTERYSSGPPLVALGLRTVSLSLGVALGMTGGYLLIVNG